MDALQGWGQRAVFDTLSQATYVESIIPDSVVKNNSWSIIL